LPLSLTAVVTAGLDGALADPAASLTVFAPNDRGFVRLARDLGFEGRGEEEAWLFLVDALAALGGGDPIPVLTDVLLYHVVPARVTVFDFVIAALFFNFFIPGNAPQWVADSRSKPFLDGLGAELLAILPDDPEGQIIDRIRGNDDEEVVGAPDSGT